MKSAEEYADELRTTCTRIENGSLRVNNDAVIELLNRVKSDAIKACAEKALGVGRAMADGYKETSCPHCKDGQIAAGNTGVLARENILALLPKGTP